MNGIARSHCSHCGFAYQHGVLFKPQFQIVRGQHAWNRRAQFVPSGPKHFGQRVMQQQVAPVVMPRTFKPRFTQQAGNRWTRHQQGPSQPPPQQTNRKVTKTDPKVTSQPGDAHRGELSKLRAALKALRTLQQPDEATKKHMEDLQRRIREQQIAITKASPLADQEATLQKFLDNQDHRLNEANAALAMAQRKVEEIQDGIIQAEDQLKTVRKQMAMQTTSVQNPVKKDGLLPEHFDMMASASCVMGPDVAPVVQTFLDNLRNLLFSDGMDKSEKIKEMMQSTSSMSDGPTPAESLQYGPSPTCKAKFVSDPYMDKPKLTHRLPGKTTEETILQSTSGASSQGPKFPFVDTPPDLG